MTNEPAAVPIPPPTGMPEWEPPFARPAGVTLVGIVETLLWALVTLGAALAAVTAFRDGDVTVATGALVGVVVAGALAFTGFKLLRADGWARATIVGVSWARAALGVLIAATAAAERGAGDVAGAVADPAFLLGLVIALYSVLVAWYLSIPEVREWFAPVDWSGPKRDAKWAGVLLLVAILGISGWNNSVWQETPEGREDIGQIVHALLGEDALVFLLQLLAVLLVAALVAAIVIAIRDPESDAGPPQAGEEYSSQGYEWGRGVR